MKVIIVGGVAGGAGTAARLRRQDEHSDIILFEKGEHISFANCGLPYFIGDVITEKNALFLQTPQSFSKRFRVDVRIQSEVCAVSPDRKTVQVHDHHTGQTYEETYDKLVLSPGAAPVRPPIPGADKPHVFTLRNVVDTFAIKDFLQHHTPRCAAVIGGGFIGLEIAENLHRLGLTVSIVEAAAHIVPGLDRDMAALVASHLRDIGIPLFLRSQCVSVGGSGVELADGQTVRADMVVFCVGVKPDTAFLRDSGLAMGPRGDILINERMESSLQDVYALGDAVSVRHYVGGQLTYVPLASPANKQARLVADNIVGLTGAYTGTQATAIVQVFGLNVAFTGKNEETLQQEGIPYVKSLVTAGSNAGYYPGSTTMTIKLLVHKENQTILGAQIVGEKAVDKRIDVLATALRAGMTVAQVGALELAYAPPFGSARDPVNTVAFVAENIFLGKTNPWYCGDVVPEGDVLVDVRTPDEYARGTLPGAVNLPLDDLRERIDELDRDKEYYLFCRMGLRGYLAERILSGYGFKAKNLMGGYRFYRKTMLIG